MATWQEMSRDAMNAAQILLEELHYRSAISRAYYAVYCGVAAKMGAGKVQFPHGWKNPSHEQVFLFLKNLFRKSPNLRKQVTTSFRRLRWGRENADYRPGATLTERDAVGLIREALLILKTMEKQR